MLKYSINLGIAMFLAFLLRGITYSVGNFNFRNSPLFSANFFYDFLIFFSYYCLALVLINKISSKKM